MNNKTGRIASIVTLAAVMCFGLSMITGTIYISYLSSILISLGFLPMICSFSSISKDEHRSVSLIAVAFAAVYAVLINLVYFTQLTTVHNSVLSDEAAALLDYRNMGLFFNYDLLGYAFMALATFFIGLTINTETKTGRWLKALLMIHGIFAVTGFIMPILGVFSPGMQGGDLIGVIVLEFWCAYFTPVCILSFNYFKKGN